jgi:holo-[acyl-carrier protein] synthase
MAVQIGLDLVAVRAVQESVGATHGQRYLERVYSPVEIRESTTRRGLNLQRLAECFAAKEATIKVLPAADEGLSLRTIEVRRDEFGSVRLVLSGRAKEMAIAAGFVSLSLSVAHDAAFATAVVVAEVSSEAS